MTYINKTMIYGFLFLKKPIWKLVLFQNDGWQARKTRNQSFWDFIS